MISIGRLQQPTQPCARELSRLENVIIHRRKHAELLLSASSNGEEKNCVTNVGAKNCERSQRGKI